MVGIIIISESKAAHEMLKTVKKTMGKKPLQGILALSIKSHFSKRTLTDQINRAMRKLKCAGGYLILSEVFGATQTNVCLDFVEPGIVELICGYNLPMLIKAASTNRTQHVTALAKTLHDTGQKHIVISGQ